MTSLLRFLISIAVGTVVLTLAVGARPVTTAASAGDHIAIRSVKLNNYNSWRFEGESPAELNRNLEIVARHDNVCFTEHWEHANNLDGWRKVTPQSIRVLNPKAKIYRIYDLCCKNTWDSDWDDPLDTNRMQTPLTRAMIDDQDWWLRDKRGEVVKENEGKTWYLDVGRQGYKEEFLRNVLDRSEGKGFDGFVFDYWWPEISSLLHGRARPDAYPTDGEWFAKAWQPFITYVMSGLRKAGYRVIGNCVGEYGTADPRQAWQRCRVDGAIYEQWTVDWPADGGRWLPGSRIQKRIRALLRDPLEVWTADYGLRSSDHAYGQKQVVSLAMYYIAIPVFQSNRSYHHMKDGSVYWENLWDFYIGMPAELAVQRPGKYFWSRKFTQGIVLLNYESAESVTYSLEREYRDPEGETVSGDVTLGPHTAMILSVCDTGSAP